MKFINYTPHVIRMNDGTEYPSEGIARVLATFGGNKGIVKQIFGDISGLPAEVNGVKIIVSAMVVGANEKLMEDGRGDLVAPATGHPEAVRNDKGHILSVPCFV